MSHTAQWSSSPQATSPSSPSTQSSLSSSSSSSLSGKEREHYNECLARFKPCQEIIRASSPSPVTPFTTASPTPAPSLVKESRAGSCSFSCRPHLPQQGSAPAARVSPFRTDPAPGRVPTANVPPFIQDLARGIPAAGKASSPVKNARSFPQLSPYKSPATLRVPPFLQGQSPRTSPDKGSPPLAHRPHLSASTPAVLVPFYQESSSSFSQPPPPASRESPSPKPTTPPKGASSPSYSQPSSFNYSATPSTKSTRSAWFESHPALALASTASASALSKGPGNNSSSPKATGSASPLKGPPPIVEEVEQQQQQQQHQKTAGAREELEAVSARWEPYSEKAEEEEEGEEDCEEEDTSSSSSSSGCLGGLLSGSITGRSQSKGGYSRMWEDPVGDRHALPLYNRLHFSTLPSRKSAAAQSSAAAAVTKKTWYLVHNTYASLQNSSNGHHPHHPHHHHSPHHPSHTYANGATRMEEVGGGGDEFRSHNHAERLMRKMENCASKRQLCDVVLIAGPKRLPAHRLVLSAASDYFAAMFMSNVREATMEEVELKDVDPEALAALVQYTYTGRIELKEETVECLLSTACLLQLSEVVEACCSFLMKQLHPSNCIGIRQFADAQGCTDLYKVANNYVMEMFVEVMHNTEFLLLPWEEVGRLLASDDLNVPNEETILEALVQWAQHQLTSRRKHLAKLLAHIKLPLMSPQYIADHVETNSLFREDRECQQLIMEALKYHLLPERRSSFQSPRTKPRKSTVGVLYAVGGMDCTKGATSIEKYELRTNTWTQVANMSGRRLQFGVAVLEDRLYVVGGRDGLKTLNTVECYDPKKKTWTLMPPMSTHRHGLGVGVLEGPMYAVGGHDGWSYLNTVERWDPQARQWSYVAPMSTARSTVGVASLHAKLYAVGGRDGSSCLKSVECFDPHTNKWTHCTPMAKRRGGVGVATCNGFLYAVGGHEAPATNPTCSRYDSAERYDPKTDQWTNISPISSPRDAVGLCPLGDKLFAVGGYDGQQYLNDVECHDPITNEWVKVASLCTGRAGACVVHVPNS